MMTSTRTVEIACKERLDEFFANYPDNALRKRTAIVMQFLETQEEPLTGKPEALAAGLIYALSNLYRRSCGVPGLLNSEFAEFFGVSIGTIRKQAARVVERLSI